MQSVLCNIEELFEKMSNDGFDSKSNLKWGFYFFDDTRANLEKVYDELKDHGYKLEKLERVDNKEWVLQVTKIETMSADRLHKRNMAFNDLANYCNVKLYDGWDVEKYE